MDIEKLRLEFLEEAINIGDHLLNTAIQAGNYLTWETVWVQPDEPNGFVYTTVDNLYNGVSGVCVYLSELYQCTADEKYLEAAINGMEWVLERQQDNSENFFAFYSGKMSIAFALIQLFRTTKNKTYVDRAVRIALESEVYATASTFDVINGISGTLMGLLHIHATSKEDRILRIIELYADRLLRAMHGGDVGLCWDRNERNTHSLCGFSHGASGLAYTFMELAFYFGNHAFNEIARQCFIYENQFYNDKFQNWKDLRAPDEIRFKSEIDDAYFTGNMEFFLKDKFMNAWCHGAAGIGLARARALELFPEYSNAEKELSICINTTISTTIVSSSDTLSSCLCHGSAGNAEIFLEYYLISRNDYYLDLAFQIGQKLLDEKSKHGRYRSGNPEGVEDNSLFMGNAGVGYCLLRLLNPDQTPSLLAPKLKLKFSNTIPGFYPTLRLTIEQLHKLFFSTDFKRTLIIAENLFPEAVDVYFKNTSTENFRASGIMFVRTLLTTDNKGTDILQDIFNLELTVNAMNLAIESDNLLFIKDKKKKEHTELLLDDKSKFEELKLIADRDIIVTKTGWNWDLKNKFEWHKNIKKTRGEFHSLLIATCSGVKEIPITMFSKIILDEFKNGIKVNDAISNLIDQFEDENHSTIRNVLKAQILELIHAGFLVDQHMYILTKNSAPFSEEILNNN